MAARQFYVVRGATKRGSVTYNCPTPEWALRKLRDFAGAHYRDVGVRGPDGEIVSEGDLELLARGPALDVAVPERQA